MYKAENVGVKNARTWRKLERKWFRMSFKQSEVVYFQTKTTQLFQNKTTFTQVALKSLYFNVLYYSDICLVQ